MRVLGMVSLLFWSSLAWGQDCSTPRTALDNLFVHLRGAEYDPALAGACLDAPEGVSAGQRAVQLKQVLDARGLWVPVQDLPDEPNPEAKQFVPMPEKFPALVVVPGEGGGWRVSRETVEAIPDLYAQSFSAISLWFQSQLPDVFYWRVLGLFGWQFAYAGLLGLGAWLIGTALRLVLKHQAMGWLKRAKLQMDERDFAALNTPVVGLVVCAVLGWGLTDLQLPIALSSVLHRALTVLTALIGIWGVSRLVDVVAKVAQGWASGTENRLDDQLVPLLRQAAQLLVLVVGGLYLADALGIDVWKLAAGVGIGGLAFALAAQDTVANFFGSVNIFVDRPFQIGDWVIVGGVEGVVEEVGFRSTRVRTFHNSLVTIPNSQITNANVDNMGVRPRRRVKMTLSLTYDTPPDLVEAYVEGVRAILAAHPDVQRSYEVHLYELAGSSLDILVYYHVVVEGWHEELKARGQNLLEFMRLASAMGVSFAFPSTSVYVESTPEHPLVAREAVGIPELEALAASFGPDGERARPGGPAFERSWSVQRRAEGDNRGSA